MEERISSHKIEMIQVEESENWNSKENEETLWELFDFIRKSHIKTVGVSRRRKRGWREQKIYLKKEYLKTSQAYKGTGCISPQSNSTVIISMKKIFHVHIIKTVKIKL